MAMALKGKNVHYKWHNIRRSHFISTAQNSGYFPKVAEQLLDEMLAQVDVVIDKVTDILPPSFPEAIARPIFKGMRDIKERLSTKL